LSPVTPGKSKMLEKVFSAKKVKTKREEIV
jgi:hypothetical protein